MKNFIQNIDQPLGGDLGVDFVFKFQNRPVFTSLHAMTPVEINLLLQLVFFNVVFDDLHRILIAPGKASTAQADDQLFFIVGAVIHGCLKIGILDQLPARPPVI